MNEEKVLTLLERYYLLEDSGDRPDIEALCDGDPNLAAHIRELVQSEQEFADSVEQRPLDLRAQEPRVEDSALPSIDGYRLLHEIGRGGMATVYLAHEEPLGDPVAIKVLHPSVSFDAAIRIRFRREAEITAALDHPNIVPILSVGESHGTLFIVMKLLEGQSLATLSANTRPRESGPTSNESSSHPKSGGFAANDIAAPGVSAQEVARIGAGLARALHDAHISGVIHRDVKPSNVILEGRTPILLDFGLAFELGSDHLTQSGTAPGTLPYMSPEQLDGRSAALDPRTDVYSLGATLHEMVSGTPPFRNENPGRLIRDILTRDAPRLPLRRSDRDLETILLRAMEKERNLRFNTCADFADELDRFIDRRPIASRRPGLRSKAARLAGRHPWAAGFGVLSLLVILSLVVFVSAQRYAFSQVFEADVARTELLLDGDADTVRAWELTRSLLQRDPSDSRALALAERCQATEALDEFFDVIHAMAGRRGVYDDADIRRAMGSLTDTGGDRIRRPFSDVAIAIGLFHLGEHERSRQTLEEAREAFGPRRSILAGLALLEGEDPLSAVSAPVHHGGSAFDRADSHVLVALMLRLMKADPASQLAEIDAALAIRGDHYRARQAAAILELRKTNYERALGLFMGITTPAGYRRTTRLQIAYTALLAGHIQIAENALRNVKPEDRYTRYAIMQAQVLRHQGNNDERLSYLRNALQEWPDDPDLTAELGYAQLSAGKPNEARQAFRRSLDLTPQERTRDRCEIQLLTLDLQDAIHQKEMGSQLPKEAGVELRDRAASLIAGVRNPLAAADLLFLKSRIEENLLDDRGIAWKSLTESLEKDPQNPTARATYAVWVGEEAAGARLGHAVRITGSLYRLRITAEDFAEQTRAGGTQGARPTPPQNKEDAEYALFLLAFARGDHATVQSVFDGFEMNAPSYWSDPGFRKYVEDVRKLSADAEGLR